MTREDTYSPQAVDFFCGAGGASLGMLEAGFNLLAGLDYDPTALDTHRKNLSGNHVQHDVRHVRPGLLPPVEVDYVHGSTQCQGFSPANNDRSLDDPRNQLVFAFLEWIERIQPKVVTLENVAGMQTIEDGFMQRLAAAFDERGYDAKWKVLNAADYGVPQTRERLFIVAVRHDVQKPTFGNWFPTPTHSKEGGHGTETWRAARVALEDDVEATKGGGEGSPNAWRDPERPAHTVTGAANHVAMTDQINETHQREGRRPLQSLDDPSNVIRTGTPPALVRTDGGSDFEKIRRLSDRELARLQSFPDWFEFEGNQTQRHRQIGNAVPPRLMKHIAQHVEKIIRGEA